MAKISLLPLESEPDGSETVVMVKDNVTRRAALGGMVGAAAAPHVAAAQLARDQAVDMVEAQRIFVDLSLGEAEAATQQGQFFKLVSTSAGTAAVYRRAAVGSELLYEEATASALNSPLGAGLVRAASGARLQDIFDLGAVRTAAQAQTATMFPDGSVVRVAGHLYRVDSTKAGPSSCTNDLGIDGLVPFDKATPHHFGAGGRGLTDDTAALKAWGAFLDANDDETGALGFGTFVFSDTIPIGRGARSIIGTIGTGQRTGSIQSSTRLVWEGGAAPMFSTSETRLTFIGFSVETNGQATDFLEMNEGGQSVYMDDVYCGPNALTRSFIRSNGNRIGYSTFRRCVLNACAPRFFDVDGQGTPNAITPINFELCQFSNLAVGPSCTVLHVRDETIESARFDRCTFISRAGLVIVDTTDAPKPVTINNLSIDRCEFDNIEGAAHRMLKLTNVRNFTLRDSILSGDGSPTHIADLVNSNVAEVVGNSGGSWGHLFNADDTSRVRGVGFNGFIWSQIEGICDNPKAALKYLDTSSFSVWVDGGEYGAGEYGFYVAEFLPGGAGGSYAIRLDTTKPENMEPGQKFAVMIKNSSGGAIAAPHFTTGFKTAEGFTAPADGFNKTYHFIFDSMNAVQTMQEGPEIANA